MILLKHLNKRNELFNSLQYAPSVMLIDNEKDMFLVNSDKVEQYRTKLIADDKLYPCKINYPIIEEQWMSDTLIMFPLYFDTFNITGEIESHSRQLGNEPHNAPFFQIGTNVTRLNDEAFVFYDENNNTLINKMDKCCIPNSVKYIGKKVFSTSEKLTHIVFQGELSKWKQIEKDEEWYNNISTDCVLTCYEGTYNLYNIINGED